MTFQAGDVVIVASGPHFLRHGVIGDGVESERTESGIAPAPDGFAVVRFMTKGGTPMTRQGNSGECEADLIRTSRLTRIASRDQASSFLELSDIRGRHERAGREAIMRARCGIAA